MRSLFRRAIVAGSCLALWAGCSAKQQTEYVTGISTQVTVPRDLKSIVIQVSVGGSVQFCQAYKVYEGVVQLPRSLGTFAQNDPTASGLIQYTIMGLSEDFTPDSANPIFTTCTGLTVGQNNARLLRRSRQPYIVDEIRFLPMPLKFACVDKACGDEETCKGGTCVSAILGKDDAAAKFPPYTSDLSDGTGGTCFHVSSFKAPDGKTDIPGCMTGAVPAITVDASKCLYTVPGPDAPPVTAPFTDPYAGFPATTGVNVQVTYDGLVKEILDSDRDEGFFLPDPVAHPQQFQLAPGLCDMAKGTSTAHTIGNILVSGTCQAKQLAQPICAPDQLAAMGVDPTGHIPTPAPAPVCGTLKLTPQPASLVVVIDNSFNGASFFKALNGKADADAPEDNIVGAAVTAAFSAPSLSNTSFGVAYTTGTSPAATPTTCDAMSPLDVPLALLTLDGVGPIFSSIDGQSARDASFTDSEIEAGLTRAYAALGTPAHANDVGRSVVVFSNRFTDGMTCSDKAVDLAKTNFEKPQSIKTYAMQVVKLPEVAPSSLPSGPADLLSIAGGTYPSAYKIADDFGAANKFKTILHDLTTCAYQVPTPTADVGQPLPTPISGTTDSLFYDDVQTGNPLDPVKFDATCVNRDVTTANGWGFTVNGATTNIYLCGAACTDYQAQLDKALLLGTTRSTPAPPVPLHLRRAVCTQP